MTLYRDFTSQAEIDLAYSLGIPAPEMTQYLLWFAGESAKARQDLTLESDVRFGASLDETLDIFPAQQPNAPVVVFVHGGNWKWGSSKDFSVVARGLVGRGFTVVVTNYSLCPKVSIDEITRQSRAAIAWLYQAVANFNGDPNRLFVAGHSAGGQQVGMVMSTPWEAEYGLPTDIIKGGIPMSGLFDLRPLQYSHLQSTIMLTDEMAQRQSPLLKIPNIAPPLLVIFGTLEPREYCRQSIDYLAAWQAAGLQGRRLAQIGKDHFSGITDLIDPSSALCNAIVEFVHDCLAGRASRTTLGGIP